MTKWHPVKTQHIKHMELDWLEITSSSGSLSTTLEWWCWCQQKVTSNGRWCRAPWAAKGAP